MKKNQKTKPDIKPNSKPNIVSVKLVVLLFLTVAGFVIYINSIKSDFHFDDFCNIVNNPDIMEITDKGFSYDTVKKAVFTDVAGSRPVAYLTFVVNYYFSRTDTTSYHAVNIIIHILNAFLIYLIILTLFDYNSADDKRKDTLTLSAFFTALLWLCTPLNSQVVIYVVQRMALLMTFFFLLAFLFYLLGRKKKNLLYLILSVVFFALSLLSKQNGIVFPIVIIIYELIFEKKGDIKNIKKEEKIIAVSLFFILLIALFIYKDSIHKSLFDGYALRDFTLYERVLTQFRVLIFYLSLLVLPLPNRLSVTHDFVKSTSLFSPITTLISFVFIIAIIIFAVKSIKKMPYLAFAIFWFFITISVESSIFPLEMAFEHRMYLPSIFLIAVFVDFIIKRFDVSKRTFVVILLCTITMLFGALTMIRGKVWKNDLTLWSNVLKKYPNNARAYYNIGVVFYTEGDYDKAMQYFESSLKIFPNYNDPLLSIGNIYAQRKNYEAAEMYLKKALANSKTDDEVYPKSMNNLGWLYSHTNRDEEALAIYEKLDSLYPQTGLTQYNLGEILEKLKKYDEAVKKYQLAIEYNYVKAFPGAYDGIVSSLVALDDIPRLELTYEKYKGLFDKLCTGYYIKYKIAKSKNELEKAKEHYMSYSSCNKERNQTPLNPVMRFAPRK